MKDLSCYIRHNEKWGTYIVLLNEEFEEAMAIAEHRVLKRITAGELDDDNVIGALSEYYREIDKVLGIDNTVMIRTASNEDERQALLDPDFNPFFC